MNAFEMPSSKSSSERGDYSGMADYPDYYGGSYIDNDGNLVVYVKADNETIKQRTNLLSSLANSNDIKYKQADYSYNILNSIMNKLNEYKLNNNNNNIANNFNSYYISDIENAVIVNLEDINEEKINEFKKNVVESPAIIFKKASGENIDQISVNCGEKITSSRGSASLGYKAKIGTTVGFFTAGHAAYVGDIVKHDGTDIGECTKSQYGGTVDAAFFKVNSSTTITNIINGTSNTLSTQISEPGVGTTINFNGQYTKKSGKILSTNYSMSIDGSTFTNLTQVDIITQSGIVAVCIIRMFLLLVRVIHLEFIKGYLAVKLYFQKLIRLINILIL